MNYGKGGNYKSWRKGAVGGSATSLRYATNFCDKLDLQSVRWSQQLSSSFALLFVFFAACHFYQLLQFS